MTFAYIALGCRKMPTLLLEGAPGVGKTKGAKVALALGSSQDHFYSGSVSFKQSF